MRIALVTGANKGIGREVARQLAGLGFTVLAAARDPERGRAAAAEVGAVPLTLDVTSADSVAAAAAEVGQRFGRLDVLVNNAGISPGRSDPADVDLDAMRRTFETNVFGVIRVTDAFLPLLRRSATPRIVNVSSSVGSLTKMSDRLGQFGGMPASTAYPTSKAALNMVTVQYAKALADTPVVVNLADPGRCATDFLPPGMTADRTAEDGARVAVRLATLPDDAPRGGLFDERGVVPW